MVIYCGFVIKFVVMGGGLDRFGFKVGFVVNGLNVGLRNVFEKSFWVSLRCVGCKWV